MVIELNQQGNTYHFQAGNESGQTVNIDASPSIGGLNKGARPMELLIMGLGGCSGIDIINILQKQKIDVRDMKVSIQAEREKEATPSLFTDIHVNFIFNSPVDQAKAQRAINLSMEKYCSVAKTLEKTAKITYSATFNEH